MQHPEKSEDKLVFMQKVDENDYPASKISLVEEKAEVTQKRDTTKVYFFIIAIIALIATNVYFYIKYQSSEEYSYGLSTEMAYMQDEIDRIEAELNRLTSENSELSKSLQASEDSVRVLIASLREKLNEQNLTRLELNNAQAEIDRLREDVIRYKNDLAVLNEQNEALLAENQNLQREVSSKQDRVQALEQANKGLSDQIRAAAVLKLSNINVMGIRELKGNKESVDDKARRVDRIRVVYTLADNPLIAHGDIVVFMRIIDPNGNLKTLENQTFELSGNPMQYTDKHTIQFTNQGESYTMDWIDPQGFKKGTYTIVLYTENSTMGRGSLVLN